MAKFLYGIIMGGLAVNLVWCLLSVDRLDNCIKAGYLVHRKQAYKMVLVEAKEELKK